MLALVVMSIIACWRLVVVQAVVPVAVRVAAPWPAPWAGLAARPLGLGQPRSQRNGRQAGISTESTIYTAKFLPHTGGIEKGGSFPPLLKNM